MVPAGSSWVTWVAVGRPVTGSRRKQGTPGVTTGTVPVHSAAGTASGSGIVCVTLRPVTGSVGSRFCIVNKHWIEAPPDAGLGEQFLVEPIPRGSKILSVPATLSVPALPARVMLVRELLEAPATQGVTALITPVITDPVKSEPPSPPAPPVTKASRLAGLPTESIWPAPLPLLSPLESSLAPWLGWPSPTGLTARAL